MTRDEFKQIVRRVRGYFPESQFVSTKEAFDLWYERLGECPLDLMRRAVDRHAEVSRFAPKLCDLRNAAIEIYKEDVEREEHEYYRTQFGDRGNKLPSD